MRRFALAIGLIASLWLAGSASALTLQSGDGLTLTAANQIDARLWALTFTTSALPKPVNVDVLLPSDYSTNTTTSYPVLYLMDGTLGHASDWTSLGGAEQTTAGQNVIVVMPDITLNGDGGGWCTNWPNGAENWETFHIDQLLPWVDANFRTVASRGQRAIAGLSQGGFCSLSYAARHPDLFGVALGYSGAPDIWYDPDARGGAGFVIGYTETADDQVPPFTFFGNPFTDGINWAAHDPATLAENLTNTKIYMYWGDGAPGPYDSGFNPQGSGIEGMIWRDNNDFQTRLNALGIPAYFDDYGSGTHSWPYWARDLQWSIGSIMSDFANPAPSPSQVSYTSGENSYSAYGWSVTMQRSAQELSTLGGASQSGFQLSGSGSGTVVTPAVYSPGATYNVAMSGPHAGGTAILTAGPDGRLTIQVPVGPSNPYPEYTAEAPTAATPVYTTSVTIGPTG